MASIVEGKEKRNIEVSKKMKEEGFSNSQIKTITGLTDEQINNL